ncbi:Phospholipase D family [Trema orientale]|uniref:Phospholipase D family n=1 Tax=Trema orientale TaxID=63057 RepID=A0A2P5FA98_TREOI|nr:Phospholipase D family [Trema orientale]
MAIVMEAAKAGHDASAGDEIYAVQVGEIVQDAHVFNDMLPKIEFDGGKVKLVREPTRPLPRDGDLTLGELLKYKSEKGVGPCLLVWDDKTSDDAYFIKTMLKLINNGEVGFRCRVMQTHDEETRKFFKHSSVICVLSPGYASNKITNLLHHNPPQRPSVKIIVKVEEKSFQSRDFNGITNPGNQLYVTGLLTRITTSDLDI